MFLNLGQIEVVDDKQLHIDDLNQKSIPTKTVTKIVGFFYKIRDVLNQNATIKSINNITSAFDNMIMSPGWTAIDTFANTFGSSLGVYDAVGGGVERTISRHQKKEEDKENEVREEEREELDETFRADMKNSLARIVGQLSYMNEQLRCNYYDEEEEEDSLTETIFYGDLRNTNELKDFSLSQTNQLKKYDEEGVDVSESEIDDNNSLDIVDSLYNYERASKEELDVPTAATQFPERPAKTGVVYNSNPNLNYPRVRVYHLIKGSNPALATVELI